MRAALALIAPCLLACTEPEAGPAPRVFTLFDLRDAFDRGSHLAVTPSFPGGIGAGGFMIADGGPLPLDDRLSATDGTPGLATSLAFVEGRPAAYTTTEVWVDHDRVWINPIYILVEAWDDKPPKDNRLKDDAGNPASPIFSVGAGSPFYSPYWRVYYAVVPPGTRDGDFTSGKAVLDAHLPLHPGPGRICTLTPHEKITFARPAGSLVPVRPLFGDAASVMRGEGAVWVDGTSTKAWAFDFGSDRFTWNADEIVDESPLFLLMRRDEHGELVSAGLPSVGGAVPLFSGRVAPLGPKPSFGSLWRMHTVTLPPGAGVFVPARHRERVLAALPGGLSFPAVASEIEARPDVDDYTLRVALKPDCFADAAAFPARCDFLDSQAQIERLVPGAIRRTEVAANCPLTYFAGAPVRE